LRVQAGSRCEGTGEPLCFILLLFFEAKAVAGLPQWGPVTQKV
jgi:hypothetical protein